ncbi:MAG: hypothetical protein JXQ96_11565 [Cyclobacteriaceae bacterium]
MSDLEAMFTTRFSKEEMMEKVRRSPENLKETIRIVTSSQEPQCWRAAWILGHSFRKEKFMLDDYVDELIAAIEGKNDGHQRELVRLLSTMKLNDDQEGRLFDICMTLWESMKKAPAVRIFAFRFIAKVVKKYPELKEEITFLTQEHYLETLSPGIRKGVEKTMNTLL